MVKFAQVSRLKEIMALYLNDLHVSGQYLRLIIYRKGKFQFLAVSFNTQQRKKSVTSVNDV